MYSGSGIGNLPKDRTSSLTLPKDTQFIKKISERNDSDGIVNLNSSAIITTHPPLYNEDKGNIEHTESIISSNFGKNQDLSKDNDLLDELSESEVLDQAVLESGSSRISLIQNEPFAIENILNRIESGSLLQGLTRFKKKFKKNFECDSELPSISDNTNRDDGVLKSNLVHPSQYFGIESFSSKPNSLALNFLQKKKSMKTGSEASSSFSMQNSLQGINSQSTARRRANPLFMLKNVFSRPGLNKKQAMVLNAGLNGNVDIGYNTGITSNGENDCVQSLDTSYDNNIKNLEEDYVETVGYDKIVSHISYETDQEKCLNSEPKSQETFSYMPTDHSLLKTKHVDEVLDHIQNQKPTMETTKDQFFSSGGFTSLIERLENRNKQKSNQSVLFDNNSLLRKIEISAYDINIHTNDYKKPRNDIEHNIAGNKSNLCSSMILGGESSFASRYDLKLEVDSQNNQATEGDRIATEGNDTLSSLDSDIDLNDLNQTFLNYKEWNPRQVRRVQIGKQQRHKSQQHHNQSCLLPQTNVLYEFPHKARLYKPFIRPREKKLVKTIYNSAKEIIKISDEKKVDVPSSISSSSFGLPCRNEKRSARCKPGRALKEYAVFSLKASQGDEKPLSREKKAIIRNIQLDMCYGDRLKINIRERFKKK